MMLSLSKQWHGLLFLRVTLSLNRSTAVTRFRVSSVSSRKSVFIYQAAESSNGLAGGNSSLARVELNAIAVASIGGGTQAVEYTSSDHPQL
jgi:hypothetical protein